MGFLRCVLELGVGAAAALFFTALSSAGRAAEIRVVGSDLLGPDFSRALYRCAAPEELRLSLALDGSRPGLEEMRAGRAQFALLSLPAMDESAIAEYESVLVAWHRVIVLVPAAAPLERITLAQLAGVFGHDAPLSIHRWGDFGVSGTWAARPVVPRAPVVGLGLTAEYFRHVVLGGKAVRGDVERYGKTAELVSYFSGDSSVVALAAVLPVGESGLKVLRVSLDAKTPAFAPTVENLDTEKYPLRLPLRAVFRREATGTVLPLLRFLAGPEGDVQLDRAGLVASAPERRRAALERVEKRLRKNLQK